MTAQYNALEVQWSWYNPEQSSNIDTCIALSLSFVVSQSARTDWAGAGYDRPLARQC
jgi:hypothetical protein